MKRTTAVWKQLGVACVAALCATTANGQFLNPDADTTLSNDSNRGPTINHGSGSQNQVRWHSAPRVRISYIRYDITGINSALFNIATLSGTFTDSGKNGPSGGGTWDVWGLDDSVVAGGGIEGNGWGESSVTYATAGGVDNSAALGTFSFVNATQLGTMSFSGNDTAPYAFLSNTSDLDLTTFLNADTDGLVTFMFMDSAQEGSEYYIDSLEGNMADGHHPMHLNFFVPEPTSIALLGIGGLALLTRRMKR